VALYSQSYLPNLRGVFLNHLRSVFPADLLPFKLPALLLVLPFLCGRLVCCFPHRSRSFFHCSHNMAAAIWFLYYSPSSLVVTHERVDYGAGTQEISTKKLSFITTQHPLASLPTANIYSVYVIGISEQPAESQSVTEQNSLHPPGSRANPGDHYCSPWHLGSLPFSYQPLPVPLVYPPLFPLPRAGRPRLSRGPAFLPLARVTREVLQTSVL